MTVAEKLDVSVATVSRALAGHPNVRPEMKKRVLQAVGHLQRNKKTSRLLLVKKKAGILLSPFRGNERAPHLLAMVESLKKTFRERYVDVAMDFYSPVALPDFLAKDFSIVILLGDFPPKLVREIAAARKIPVVLWGNAVPMERVYSVVEDAKEAVLDAVAHLLALGHKRLAIVTVDAADSYYYRSILKAVAEAKALYELDDKSLRVASLNASEDPIKASQESVGKLLDEKSPPTAFLFLAYHSLQGGLTEFGKRRMRIPKDLSVVVRTQGDSGDLKKSFPGSFSHLEIPVAESGKTLSRIVGRLLQEKAVKNPVKKIRVLFHRGDTTLSPTKP